MRALKQAVGAALLTAGALVPALAQQAPIKIGAINPYSGPFALYGAEVGRGYELAVDRINASGGNINLTGLAGNNIVKEDTVPRTSRQSNFGEHAVRKIIRVMHSD